MRKIFILSAAILAIVPLTSHAVPLVIDFEADALGAVANGYSAVGHPDVSFTDTMGANLILGNFLESNNSNALATFADDPSQLQIDFVNNVSFLSMDFGNDDPSVAVAGDRAWLITYLNSVLVGSVSVVLNIDDLMNQTIAIAGLFDQAFFYYGDAGGVAIGLIELVDNVTYEVAVPEPGTLALLGIGLAGMGLARRRRKV